LPPFEDIWDPRQRKLVSCEGEQIFTHLKKNLKCVVQALATPRGGFAPPSELFCRAANDFVLRKGYVFPRKQFVAARERFDMRKTNPTRWQEIATDVFPESRPIAPLQGADEPHTLECFAADSDAEDA
jgi:hypothetical protein